MLKLHASTIPYLYSDWKGKSFTYYHEEYGIIIHNEDVEAILLIITRTWFYSPQVICEELERTQPFIEKLNSRGKELQNALPEGDKEYLKTQLETLNKLQESVIRSAVGRQEELIHKILQQQDFDTQLQTCLHVVNEVETSVCNEFDVEADTGAMKEKLALCQV